MKISNGKKTDFNRKTKDESNKSLYIFSGLVVIIFIVLALLAVWKIPHMHNRSYRDHLESINNANVNTGERILIERNAADIENNSRVTIAQIVGGLGLLLGLFLTYLNVKAAQDNARTAQKTLRITADEKISDRFGKAVEMLGKEDLTMSLSGIYALERLSLELDDWEKLTVMEVLTAYVRENSCYNSGETAGIKKNESILRDIIQTIMTVIGRRELNESESRRFNLRGVNLAGYNLEGANLAKMDLSEADISGANLTGAYLNEAILTGADLTGADLTKADLFDADLSEADLTDAIMNQADLVGTDLNLAILIGADLTDANLLSADLTEADLNQADLSHANLTGADLSDADLRKANLFGANLTTANLSGANLTGTDLNEAKLAGANLNGVNLEKTLNVSLKHLQSTSEREGVKLSPELKKEFEGWIAAEKKEMNELLAKIRELSKPQKKQAKENSSVIEDSSGNPSEE